MRRHGSTAFFGGAVLAQLRSLAMRSARCRATCRQFDARGGELGVLAPRCCYGMLCRHRRRGKPQPSLFALLPLMVAGRSSVGGTSAFPFPLENSADYDD